MPAAGYSDPVTGITNAALRDYRRIHAAAATVQCAGASLTARLAIGGGGYSEFDPAVIYCNPPLASVLRKLWEQPTSRADFARCWWKAREVARQLTTREQWARAGGPLVAACLHFERIGAAWASPILD